MTREVHGCADCPLATDGVWCVHPNAGPDVDAPDDRRMELPEHGAPPWCPLRREPLTLRLVALERNEKHG